MTDWAVTKLRWQLALYPPEKAALGKKRNACPDAPLNVTVAR
ncbi:hypothetical protein [Streptomyces sp. cg35]